ncbi:hypothetical protein [Nocardia arthritidis]|uniref:hypothetical protein n=1 Tax=Nocardia arthritidis TaxID=228602 RepID=UPI000ADF899C|nr:hypothetical protein [Nocardia arthritidis]
MSGSRIALIEAGNRIAWRLLDIRSGTVSREQVIIKGPCSVGDGGAAESPEPIAES